MVMAIILFILGVILLLVFACISCLYSCCRCCSEKVIDEALELNEELNAAADSFREALEGTDEEKIEHNYCWNYFSHFAIPMFIYFILYSVLLWRGWQYAF